MFSLAVSLPGCVDYLGRRGRDALDIPTVAAETVCWGLKAEVGPFGYLGAYCSGADKKGQARGVGLVGGRWTSYRFFDCTFPPFLCFLHRVYQTEDDSRRKEFFVAGGWFIPWLFPQTEERAFFGGFEEAADGRRVAPRYTAVEIAAGVGYGGFRVGLNPGETLDFILGWFGLDIYGDDSPQEKSQGPGDLPPRPGPPFG